MATFNSFSPPPELAVVDGFFVPGTAFLAVLLGAFLAAAGAGFGDCAVVFAAGAGAAGFFTPEADGLVCAAEDGGAAGGLPVAWVAGFAAGFDAAGVAGVAFAGFACAYRPGAAVASVIPNTRVFTKRIFRSFPFSVSPPVPPDLLPLRRHSAW